MKNLISAEFEKSISVKQDLLPDCIEILPKMARVIVEAFRKGNKLLIFGNGGSAADAQHIAGELVGRFKYEREGLPCIALTTDTSIITAVANDFDYDYIFARQIEGLATEGDICLAISTSGNSPNVLKAISKARSKGCSVLAFSGKGGGKMVDVSDHAVVVPSDNSQRIQESHILLAHTLCLLIEMYYLDKA